MTVRWAVTLFLLVVVLQRFAVPGSEVPLVLPAALAWIAQGLRWRVLEAHGPRVLWWVLAAGLTALVGPLQVALVSAPIISVGSWALLLMTFLPAVLRFRVRSEDVYRRVLRGVAGASVGLAALAVLFMVVQFAGIGYVDVVGRLLPGALELDGFETTYPLVYGSEIYRSNAWIGLEASFVSFMLALGALAGFLARVPLAWVAVILAGMLATAAGSGVLLLTIGLIVLVVTSGGDALRPVLVGGLAFLALAVATPMGPAMLNRVTEVRDTDSSTALRATQPYRTLVPEWVNDPVAVVLGRGAGASERLVDDTGVRGLFVPTVAKIFVDYGLLAGILLFILVFQTYLSGGGLPIAAGIAVSMWTLQAAAPHFVLLAVVLVTWWSPSWRPGPPTSGASRAAGGRRERVAA